MQMLLSRFYVFILLCCAPVISGAQHKINILGNVSDSQGFPIINADVYCAGIQSYSSKTDSLGNFSIELTEPGRYLIYVEQSGFQKAEEELLVISGKDARIEIKLEERAIILDEVAVSGVKDNPVTGSYTIPIEKALRMPANFFDPLRLVTMLPGVSNGNDQANGITIRGYSPNEIGRAHV